MKLFKWMLFKPWPITIFLPILIVHLLLVFTPCLSNEYLCYGNSKINQLVALCMQLLGGLLILISIDSNIGLFKNKNIFGLVSEWYQQRPWKRQERKNVEVSINVTLPAFQVNARGHKVPETLEEKVELLEKKIEWLNQDFKENKMKSSEKLQTLESTLSQNSNAQSQQISSLKSSLVCCW